MVGFYWIRSQLSFKILIRLIGPTSAILDIKDNFEIKTMVKKHSNLIKLLPSQRGYDIFIKCPKF